jgi:tRNA (mo5U34)-methyltransferase
VSATVGEPELSAAEIEARLAELGFYHSIDIKPGVSTKGWWDLRHALPLMPFPDVKGKRCLDIGTWDGFYAYEMERRGAAEVVAIDVADMAEVDYPPEARADPYFDPSHTGKQPRSAGFHLLHELLESNVQWRGANVYDLNPDDHGTFDVVIMGSLLVHLRDPVRALDAIRSVLSPGGKFLSVDFIHPVVHLLARRRPLFELRAVGSDFQWWLASEAGLRHLLHVGGFTITDASPMFLLRPGPLLGGSYREPGPSGVAKWLIRWAVTGDRTRGGHLHRAFLAQRRF